MKDGLYIPPVQRRPLKIAPRGSPAPIFARIICFPRGVHRESLLLPAPLMAVDTVQTLMSRPPEKIRILCSSIFIITCLDKETIAISYKMFLKEVISVLLSPLPIAFVGCILGLLLLFFRRKAALGMISISLLQLWFFSLPIVGDFLLYSLARHHPPIIALTEQVDYIVVLGSFHRNSSSPSTLSSLNEDALKRLAEGIRLLKNQEQAYLWLGGEKLSGVNHAVRMKEAAIELGVPAERILIHTEVHNTRTEIETLKKNTQFGDNIVIVSSAYHLPRVSRWTQYYNLLPLYAPADSYPRPNTKNLSSFLLPRTYALQNSVIAWHEYFGIVHWFLFTLPKLDFLK